MTVLSIIGLEHQQLLELIAYGKLLKENEIPSRSKLRGI